MRLELGESLDGLAGSWENAEDVEADSLGQWTALANGNLVTLLNTESWGDVGSEVLVALLVTSVLWNKVEVLATDDESAVHLGGDDGSGEDTATDGDLSGEWALLVDVGALNGGLWGLEAQSDVLVPSATVLASAGGLDLNLGVKEDVWLLLESALSLDGQFGGHFCGWWMSRWSKVVGFEIGLVVVELLLHRIGTPKRKLLGLENPAKLFSWGARRG